MGNMQDRISAASKRTIIQITTNYDPTYVIPRLRKFADLYNYALEQNAEEPLRDIIREEKICLNVLFNKKLAAKKTKKVRRNV